jgi:hypothetical protein
MKKTPANTGFTGVSQLKAPVGVEPTMTDLQSVALATWPRSQRTVSSASDSCQLSLLTEKSEEDAKLAELSMPVSNFSVGGSVSQLRRQAT